MFQFYFTYNHGIRLVGKRVVDLLLVLTELFSLVVMAEALNTSDCRFKNR